MHVGDQEVRVSKGVGGPSQGPLLHVPMFQRYVERFRMFDPIITCVYV